MAQTETDFLQCLISCKFDPPPNIDVAILAERETEAEMDAYVKDVEKHRGKSSAQRVAALKNSPLVANAQFGNLKTRWMQNNTALAQNSGSLQDDFYNEHIEAPQRLAIFKKMNLDQAISVAESASKDSARMEKFRTTMQKLTIEEREKILYPTVVSRTSEDFVVAYWDFIEKQKHSTEDEELRRSLENEKRMLFAELSPSTKIRLWKKTALEAIQGDDTRLQELQTKNEGGIMVPGPIFEHVQPEDIKNYNAAFQNIIFETSPRNPQEMAEMASIYSLMPQEARTAYLKTSQQDQKAIDHILAIRDAAATRGDIATVQVIEQDFKGAGMISKYTQPSQQAVRQAQPKATQLGGQPESRARGSGSAQLNQEALRQAREQSGGAGEVSVSPAVREITTLPPAQGATKYIESTPQVAQEMIQKHPEYIIAMRDEASADAQARIINDIKSSKPARRFGSVKTSEERKKLFIGGDGIEALSQQEQKIILEAVADNPLQLTHLRSAIQQLSREQQKQFYENVLAEASEQARQQYAQHVRQEKIVATQENRAVDVERLTREEQVIISKRPLMRQQAPQVDAIKPNGKKTAAAILTPPPPSATVTVAPRGKTVEGAETVAPGGTAAPAEGVPISAIETFKEKLRKARSKEELEALLKELTAYRDGLRLLRQGQLEQGLAETSYEIKNTDRLISEAELLIEEIKKQLAKFSS